MIDLDAIQVQRAQEQMRDSRCWRIVRWRHERDSWAVKTDRPVPRQAPRERCIACGRSRTGSHFRLYCGPCGLRVHKMGTCDGPRDFLIWEIGRDNHVSDNVNREER
jgi:hypothetical protein